MIAKTSQEMEMLKKAGRICAELLRSIKSLIRPGINTKELDIFAEKFINEKGAKPAFKGYRGYPATICVSINEEIVHGIPHDNKKIKEGDLVSIDVGVNFQGFYADAAKSFGVGKIKKVLKKLLKVTYQALLLGIKKAKAGNYVGDISSAIQNFVEKNGFNVIREYTGHGIGRNLHEAPQIPNFGREREGERLEEGMVLAIEPMVAAGSYEVIVLDDGWTAITKDRLPAAHFEHTVLVTKKGGYILTK